MKEAPRFLAEFQQPTVPLQQQVQELDFKDIKKMSGLVKEPEFIDFQRELFRWITNNPATLSLDDALKGFGKSVKSRYDPKTGKFDKKMKQRFTRNLFSFLGL
jgi:hypothetical protein